MERRDLDHLFLRFRTEGDLGALARLFDELQPRLARLAHHVAPGPGEAEDLVQTTFLRAIERADSYDGERPVTAWLAGILQRQAAHERRRAARSPDVLRIVRGDGEDPEREASEREVRRALAHAVAELPQPYRDVVHRTVLLEQEVRQTARQLERAPGTVRVQLHRGLRLLRRALPAGLAPGAGAWPTAPSLGRVALLLRAAEVRPAPAAPPWWAAVPALPGGLAWPWVAALALAALGLWIAMARDGGAPATPHDARHVELAGEAARGLDRGAAELGAASADVRRPVENVGAAVEGSEAASLVLRGSVLDGRRGPVAGARVAVYGHADQTLLGEARTDDDGGFALALEPPSSARDADATLAARSGSSAVALALVLPAGGEVELDPIGLREGRTVRVAVTSEGRPAAGAEVLVYAGRHRMLAARGDSDARGRAELGPLPRGPVLAIARTPEREGRTMGFLSPRRGGDLPVALVPRVDVPVVVRDAHDRPVPGALVAVEERVWDDAFFPAAGPEPAPQYRARGSATTDERGRATLAGLPRDGVLLARVRADDRTEAARREVPRDGSVLVLRLEPHAPPTTTRDVVDRDETHGAPPEETAARLVVRLHPAPAGGVQLGLLALDTTGAWGPEVSLGGPLEQPNEAAAPDGAPGSRYGFDGLAPGRYRVHERRTGALGPTVDLARGERREQVLDLSRRRRVRGRVDLPEGADRSLVRVLARGPELDDGSGERLPALNLPDGTTLDEDGAFEALVPDDRPVRLIAWHPWLVPDPVRGELALAAGTGERAGVTLALVEGDRVEVPLGLPPSRELRRWRTNVRVYAYGGTPIGAPEHRFHAPLVGDRARFSGLPPGNWNLWIDLGPEDTRAPLHLEGAVVAPGVTVLDVPAAPRGSTLRLRLVPPAGRPVPRVIARAVHASEPRYRRQAFGESEPVLELTGLGPGRFALELIGRGLDADFDPTFDVDGTSDRELVVRFR